MDVKRTVLTALDYAAESFEHDADEDDPELRASNKQLVEDMREAYRLIETGATVLM